MSERPDAVKPTYRPVKNSEMKPVAEIYKELMSGTGVLADFTAKDSHVDSAWMTAFGTSITAVGNIVPSRTIIKLNKDITKSIKDNSKKSVEYGKTLSYWLKKAFPTQPGLIETFPIFQANDKMRLGETEGFLFDLNTIIQQIVANQTALATAGWPASNLADYQALRTAVNALNVQQELAKKLVPENTDAAMLVRNHCYSYVQTAVTLKDMVYYSDKLKRHLWALSTNLNQIRSGVGDGRVEVMEGDVAGSSNGSFSLMGMLITDNTEVKRELSGPLKGWGSNVVESIPGPGETSWDMPSGNGTKPILEFVTLTGLGEPKPIFNMQNSGGDPVHYKFTFTRLGPLP
jgi:hypothetical protein